MGTKNIKRRCAGCDNLLTGRSDKKFCTAKCKSSHHNQRKRAGEHLATTEGKERVRNDLMRLAGFIPETNWELNHHGLILTKQPKS